MAFQLLKWLLIVLVGIEIGSFLIITISNYIIFGKMREGSDCRDILTSRTEPVYQADGVHLLDAGRKLVAGHMAQVLEKRQAKP